MEATHGFKDTQGREYRLEITFGDIKRVKSLMNVNILDFSGGNIPKDENAVANMAFEDLPIQLRLQMDEIFLVDVVYCLVKPQVEEKGLTDEDFGSSLSPACFSVMKDAFWGAYRDFFHRSGAKEKAKLVEASIEAMALIKKEVSDMNVMEAVHSKVNKALADFRDSTSGS